MTPIEMAELVQGCGADKDLQTLARAACSEIDRLRDENERLRALMRCDVNGCNNPPRVCFTHGQ